VSATSQHRIDMLLRVCVERNASDLHLAVGAHPMMRVDGDIRRLKWRALTEADFENLVTPITPPRILKEYRETGDTDFAYAMGNPVKARFRVNLLRQHNGSGAVFRVIPPRVLTIEELALPSEVSAVSRVARGLVLVTGPTGSGKSTTLAAILDRLNRTRALHIVTIEDPVEFLHTSQKSILTHRELGPDTPDFGGALKAAMREDPDVVLVGELRDLETMRMALQAAETGVLVFGTLHTNSAVKAVDRLIDAFPGDEQEQVRTVLAEVLKAVVAQVLCKKIGGGRVPAFEVLRGSAALSNAIRDGKIAIINSMIQTGRAQGMIGMDQSLADLIAAQVIDDDEGYEKAIDKDQFKSLVTKRKAMRQSAVAVPAARGASNAAAPPAG
jgi:twitching motility protein PilT